jgi:hypothetical protein
MTLSVLSLWVGFDKSVDGAVLVIANKGLPTEQRWALGPWCGIEGAPEIGRRAAKLLRRELFVDDVPSQIEEGAEQLVESRTKTQRFNS